MSYSRRELEGLDPAALRTTSITFSLKPNVLSFDDFDRFVRYVRRVIRDVTVNFCGESNGWILTNLTFGSAAVSAAPIGTDARLLEVERVIIEGFEKIKLSAEKPPYFSEKTVRYAGVLASLSRDDGLTIRGQAGSVSLDQHAVKNVRAMLTARRTYWGSISGSLDVVSVHRGFLATVYGDAGEIVKCRVDADLIERAKDYLGGRVLITGIVSVNGLGNILSIDAENLFAAPKPKHFAGVSAFFGAIPDITDHLSSSDFLERAWQS